MESHGPASQSKNTALWRPEEQGLLVSHVISSLVASTPKSLNDFQCCQGALSDDLDLPTLPQTLSLPSRTLRAESAGRPHLSSPH